MLRAYRVCRGAAARGSRQPAPRCLSRRRCGWLWGRAFEAVAGCGRAAGNNPCCSAVWGTNPGPVPPASWAERTTNQFQTSTQEAPLYGGLQQQHWITVHTFINVFKMSPLQETCHLCFKRDDGDKHMKIPSCSQPVTSAELVFPTCSRKPAQPAPDLSGSCSATGPESGVSDSAQPAYWLQHRSPPSAQHTFFSDYWHRCLYWSVLEDVCLFFFFFLENDK